MRKINLLVCFLLSAFASFAQSDGKAERLDSLFTMLHAQNQFNGSVLIAQKGKIILAKGYGYADEASKKNNDANTIFELASCSKQFTAAAIVLLKRQGKLQYSDKLSRYIPELSRWSEVTVCDLLRHTSGLPDYIADMGKAWDSTKIATTDDVIAFYAKRPDTLAFAPGSQHRYNNTNYVVLASIVERISHRNFADFVSENIFKPLKMKNTFVYNRRQHPKKLKNYAIGYVWAKNSFDKVTMDDVRYGDKSVYFLDGIVGVAKVNSTVEDLYKWITALKNNTFFSKSEFDEMTEMTKTKPAGAKIPYGFGLDLSGGSDNLSFGHTGSWDGYSTFTYHSVKKDVTIVILQNFRMGAYSFENIMQVLGEKPLVAKFRKKIDLPADDVKKFVGSYVDEDDKEEVQLITYLDGHLVHNSKRVPWDLRFFPVAPNEFQGVRQGGTDGLLKFTTLENGDVKLEMLMYGKVVGKGTRKAQPKS